MPKVTDPTLLKQLNGGGSPTSGKVTDPSILAQLNGSGGSPDDAPLSDNPLVAAGAGFSQAKKALGADWQTYLKGVTSPQGRQPARAGTTNLDVTAERIPGDVGSLIGLPIREALASVLKGPGGLVRPVINRIPGATPIGSNEAGARRLAETGLLAPAVLGGMKGVGRQSSLSRVGALEEGAAAAPAAIAKPNVAELKVGEALHKSLAREGVTSAEAIESLKKNPNRPAFHAGGENMVGYAKAVARQPGPGKAILRKAVSQHQRDVPGQIKADIGEHLGGKGDYFSTLDQTLDNRRKIASSVMDQIGQSPITLDENSVRALRSDLSAPAIKKAALRALADPDPSMAEAGAALNRLHDQLLDNPGAATIRIRDAQDISKALLDASDSAYKSGNGADGKVLKSLGRSIRNNAADPEKGGMSEYGDWLKRYGHDSENKEALELGRSAINAGMDNTAEAIKRRLSKMSSEASKDYYRKGLGEGLIYMVRSAQGGVNAMRNLVKSEEFRDKVHLAFPNHEAYDAFMDAAEERVAEQDRSNRVLRGSDTVENREAIEDLKKQGASALDIAREGARAIQRPERLVAKGFEKALDAIPQADRSLLGDPETNAMLARALSDPKEMERILTATDPAVLKSEPIFSKKTPPLAGGSALSQALDKIK
jgi:hypothetical protein